MAELVTDPGDPRLTHGADAERAPQAAVYLILSDAERLQGFVRPLRRTYVHAFAVGRACGVATTMSQKIAETYARDPKFYGATYCVGCAQHLPVSQFVWDGTDDLVGS